MADISKIVTPNGDEYNLKDPTARAAAATMTGASSSADGAGGTVPAPVAGQQARFLRGDATWAEVRVPDPPVMIGATASTGGASGLVPAPAAGDQDKVLMGNGQWVQNGTMRIWYGTCETSGNVSDKEATVPGLTALSINDIYFIKFTWQYTGSATLNINSLGAYAIWHGGNAYYNDFYGKFIWNGTQFLEVTYSSDYYSGRTRYSLLANKYNFAVIKQRYDASPIPIPSAGTTVRYNVTGMTEYHRVVHWGFSSSPENSPPCSLTIQTYYNYFTLTNNSGSSSETISPVFLTHCDVDDDEFTLYQG